MSDEDTSLAAHIGTVASTTTAIGHCTQDTHGIDKCNSIVVTAATTSVDNDYNECEQVDLPLTIPTTTIAIPTTKSIVRRPDATPTVFLTTPSIAITSVAADTSSATPTIAPTSITSTTKRTCKRTSKIDFVRFDSVETVYKQTDHDEVIRRATIKDEIKR